MNAEWLVVIVWCAVYIGVVLACWRYIYFRTDSHLIPKAPEPISRTLGEQLVLEAICGASNLHAVHSGYVMAASAQRRATSPDERMFYDACLGAALRQLIDEHRALNPEPITQTTEEAPASIGNTAHH